MPIRDSWQMYLIEVHLAKNYPKSNLDAYPSNPNPFLEALLPSLLHIRLCSILEEALKERIGNNNSMNLDGKIDFLDAQVGLKDAAKLHSIRQTRNELAHDFSRSCTWEDLQRAVEAVDIELQALGLVDPQPKFMFYAERSLPEPPTETGYLHSRVYGFGLKIKRKKVVEFKWTINHGLGSVNVTHTEIIWGQKTNPPQDGK